MSSSDPFASPESLLAQHRFLRPIVRSLLRGDDGEDDVVQETVVRAWQRGPAATHPGSWLQRVARNLSIDRLRAAQRDARLRAALPTADVAPSVDEVLQQEEQRARVVHAVLALPQPYRAVVLLRFWEELPPAAIATRLAIPGATVRSQLKRGLAMLRERLDADYGDRRTWVNALAPFAGAGGGVHLFAWGLLLMTITKTKVAALAATLLVAGLGVLWLLADPAPAALPGGGGVPAGPAAPAVAAVAPPAGVEPSAPAAPAARVAAVPAEELVVRGQVLQRGVPYPGLELTLQWFDGMSTGGAPESTRQVVGDEQGRFVWRGRARETPGTVVAVAPKQRLKVWCTGETVLPGQREVKLSVSVVAFDRVLSGRVHSAGTPIVGARLDVNLWPESEVTTGADGRYEMHVPAPGYPLTVRAAGYRERLVQGYLPGDAMRHEFDVELVPGAQLVGRVVDGDGRPVEGAKVRASGAFHGVDSGADGTFVVDGMAAGHNHAVVVTKKGYQRTRAFGTAGGEPLAIVLQPGLTVALRVVDPAAAPIVGATVHLVPQPMSAWTRLGITGLDGCFAVTELSKEAVELVVEKAGFVTARRPVAAGEASGELVVTLAPGHAISGQVVDAAGQPIAGASIRCERGGASVDRRDGRADLRAVGSQVSSDADGRFEVTGVPPEPCTLFAHHVGYQPGEFAFVGGATAETTVRLQRAPAVAGRVVDGTTGAPIAAFTVGVEGNIERMPLYLDPLPFQAADGSWLVRNWQLKTGVRFSIVVSAPGYATVRVVTEAVTEPAPDQNIVRLFAGTRVTGVVRDPASGQPLAGVTVALVTPDPALRPNEGPATDASGAFVIAAVPAGEQRLRLQHLDRPEVVFGPFVVGAGPGEVEVQPTMSAGVALRGRVTGVADAAGLTVQAYRADGRIAKATVRDDLTFELRGLGIGRTRICIGEPSKRTRYLRIEVGDHDVDGFVLPLRSGAGVIRLTVEGAVSGLAEVRRLDTPAGQAEISDDVEFRGGALVDGLPPGRYRVVVRANEGGKRGSADVDVPGGEVALHIVCGARD